MKIMKTIIKAIKDAIKDDWPWFSSIAIMIAVIAVIVSSVTSADAERDRIRKEKGLRTERITSKTVETNGLWLTGTSYEFFTVEIDGHEFLIGSNSKGMTMLHKPNCMGCNALREGTEKR